MFITHMISSTGQWSDWNILHQLKTQGKLDRALNSVLPCRLAGELPLFLFLSLFLDYLNTLVSKTTERTKTHTTQLTPSSHPCLTLQIFAVPSSQQFGHNLQTTFFAMSRLVGEWQRTEGGGRWLVEMLPAYPLYVAVLHPKCNGVWHTWGSFED